MVKVEACVPSYLIFKMIIACVLCVSDGMCMLCHIRGGHCIEQTLPSVISLLPMGIKLLCQTWAASTFTYKAILPILQNAFKVILMVERIGTWNNVA